MNDDVIKNTEVGMNKSIDALKRDFGKVRTGRASMTLLDDVMVNYYGTPTQVSQLATLAIPESRMITIQPWEKNLIPEIEKAIYKADLGVSPSSDGELIRLSLPSLTEETRKDMAKLVKKIGEDHKINVRTVRREANEKLKKLEKDKDITQDELKKGEKDVQELTDRFVALIDASVHSKEKEVMEI